VKTDPAHPVFGLVDRLRSALRTGKRLRLEPEHAKVLMSEEIYIAISRLEAQEMRRLCEGQSNSDNRSATFGSGSGPSFTPGRSAGSNEIPVDAVSRGASLLLRKEAALTLRRNKHSTHSQPTI
jgi:hypothetical protein